MFLGAVCGLLIGIVGALAVADVLGERTRDPVMGSGAGFALIYAGIPIVIIATAAGTLVGGLVSGLVSGLRLYHREKS